MNSHLQDEHKIFEGPYDIRAYNDKNIIGFNRVYKKTLEDNKEDKSLSNEENLRDVVTVYIPKKKGKYPLILISHGWANYKYGLLPIGHYLASYGYAVALFTSKKKALPKDWIPTFTAVHNLIKNKNEDSSHDLYSLIDINNIGIVPHSMSGPASFYYASLRPEVKAISAIHPYNGASPIVEAIASSNEELGDEFPKIKSAVLFLTSEIDRSAYPEKTYKFFKNLNKDAPACFLSFKNIKHNGALDIFRTPLSGGYDEKAFKLYSRLSVLWFDAFLKGKKENLKYFQIDDESFQDIKDLLYTEIRREHEAYPSYDSRNLK